MRAQVNITNSALYLNAVIMNAEGEAMHVKQ